MYVVFPVLYELIGYFEFPVEHVNAILHKGVKGTDNFLQMFSAQVLYMSEHKPK